MKNILAIETSCDETAVAHLSINNGVPVLVRELISSQTDLHRLYGGVVPELASREHLRTLPILTENLLKESSIEYSDIDAIVVTRGPGLKGALLMGIGFAKGIALARSIPLLGVSHIEGHVLSAILDNAELSFPYLALVVSGGHTEIHRVAGVGEYHLIARTIDDAAGEAFDKSANLLGLEYPGGPKLAALADTVTSSRFTLPKVMREASGFSFSGLKTAIALLIKKHPEHLTDLQVKAEMAFAIQAAIVDALVFKTRAAAKEHALSRIAVCGGVAANRALRAALEKIADVRIFTPKPIHCMDNAGMIGFAGAARLLRGERDALSIDALARWPLEQLASRSN